jgi:exodeoxyribonuclease VII small subunit
LRHGGESDGADQAPTTGGAETQLTYEQARDELAGIVGRLTRRDPRESLALWQRGEDLAALCERYLDAAVNASTPPRGPDAPSA